MPGHVIGGGNGVVHMDGGMLRLAVVEWRDCSAQVGVPARGLERGSCSTPQLPPCSPAASSDSATALCPSRAHVQDGNPPEEGPPGPAIKLVQVVLQVPKHLMSFELSNTSVGPHRWYPWSFCSQTIIVPWIDLTETSAFGRVCWKP